MSIARRRGYGGGGAYKGWPMEWWGGKRAMLWKWRSEDMYYVSVLN